MKNSAQKFLKYIYISGNILLAFYILVNTSFLQSTLYKYLAEQNGFTKTEYSIALNHRIIENNVHPPHLGKIDHNTSSRPADVSKIYFLLAVISSVQLFKAKGFINKKRLKETFGFFRKLIPLFQRLFCIGAITLRAPPLFA